MDKEQDKEFKSAVEVLLTGVALHAMLQQTLGPPSDEEMKRIPEAAVRIGKQTASLVLKK